MDAFIRGLPKVELHLHIEGTLEPEMMFRLAERNGMTLPFASVDEVRRAYEFTDLQSFLDIYYQGAAVLRTAADFYDLMWAYLERAAADGVRHAEMFFDPQTHTERGVGFPVFMAGFARAQADARERLGITSHLIMCFLRHLSGEAALETLEEARPFFADIVAVGLDSGERGNPTAAFRGGLRPGPRRRPALPWPMPARRGPRPTSATRSTSWAPSASTTAWPASRTPPSLSAWRRTASPSPCARSPT